MAWDLGHLPTLVRSCVKRQALEDGTFAQYLQEEYVEEVMRIRARMSHNIFNLYMTGDWRDPVPVEDTIGTKYGMAIKDGARKFMLRFFGTKDMTLTKLKKKMVWLEKTISEKLKIFAGHHIMAL